MGRRMEEAIREGDTSHTDEDSGDTDVQERGSMEVIGAPQGERALLTLTRSYTDEDTYWGRGKSKSFPQEVTSGSRVEGRCAQGMAAGDYAWVGMGGSSSSMYGKATSQLERKSEQCEGRDMSNEGAAWQERMETPVPEPGNPDAQVQQKRKKSKSSKEKKRGQNNGGYKEPCQGGGHQCGQGGSFQDLYRGQSLEEEDIIEGESEVREDSSCSAEATDVGTTEGSRRREINGSKGTLAGIDGRGSKEGLPFSKEMNCSLGGMKDFSEDVPESTKPHEDRPPSSGSYRDVFRSPGNGSSGSAEGLEMEHSNFHNGDPSRGLGRALKEWDGEMEEKNFNPTNYQHLQFVAQNCSSPGHQMRSVGPSGLEGCGTVEETGTWCWCLHLYLGDSEGASHVESDTADEGQSGECGYSMSSTLRVGEHLDERNGDGGANLGDIPEPLTKKTGKMGETPELKEWVNWWQGWAGSCRAGSGRRRGKMAQAWGCRGETRDGQKQQDVWVLREWTRRDGGKRGENGPRVSSSEVWVLREQEEGKRDSAWPLGKEDVWVPREPRKQRSAYFMADSKWTPRSAKPGVSDKGEP